MRQARLAALEACDFDETGADHGEGEAEEHGGDDEPRVADFEQQLRRAVLRLGRARAGFEMPRAARIVAGFHREPPERGDRGAAVGWEEADGGAAGAAAAGGVGERHGS